MAYAVRADLVDRYSEAEITALETVGLDYAESAVSAAALADAEEEINSLVAVRYALPLPSVPSPLKSAVCDVARFKLYKDQATDEVKYRYERAMKWAVMVSKGEALLVFDPAFTTPEQVAAIADPLGPVAAAFAGGVFNDDHLDKMVDFNRVSSGLGLGRGWRG
jgi:phage gp36-like protein